ncbi:MAG: hypothetical protein WCG00_16000 [Hyphomicrobiales bacterium]
MRKPCVRLPLIAITIAVIGLSVSLGQAAAQAPAARIDEALQNITSLVREGQVGYATFWDGNKFVQCRRLATRDLRCEAAGASMQPSLRNILSGDRLTRLISLGWALDPSFGNYTRTFPADMATAVTAQHIVKTLTEAYDANPANLEINTKWVKDVPCPPRAGYTQNLAGSVNDAMSMKSTAVHACAFTPPPIRAQRVASAAELVAQYGPLVTSEIQRLRINYTRDVFAVFNPGIGYIQCAPELTPPALYCEAQSAESWEPLASIITPERETMLRNAGYADPGRAPNYWKQYPLDKYTDAAIASEILTILYDVYGYAGALKLKIAPK